jgi:hypothetical protein
MDAFRGKISAIWAEVETPPDLRNAKPSGFFETTMRIFVDGWGLAPAKVRRHIPF